MELFLFAAACSCCLISPPLAALALRCGLEASLRFSPRAAMALSAAAGLCACFAALARRGSLHTACRGPLALAALTGGTLGRMLALMLEARLFSSRAFGRVQALPLLALVIAACLPGRLRFPRTVRVLAALAFCCALTEGFFGAGALALYALAAPTGVRRSDAPQTGALLVRACAQGAALLLTLLCGAAQTFPARIPAALALGAAAGAALREQTKKRGVLSRRMRAALAVYAILAALACTEQAFLS